MLKNFWILFLVKIITFILYFNLKIYLILYFYFFLFVFCKSNILVPVLRHLVLLSRLTPLPNLKFSNTCDQIQNKNNNKTYSTLQNFSNLCFFHALLLFHSPSNFKQPTMFKYLVSPLSFHFHNLRGAS